MMSRPRLFVLSALILLAIFLFTPTLPMKAAKALDQANMFVYPDSIVNPALTPSNNFTITINVSDVANLFTWQVKLRFDPSIMECTDAYYPPGHVFDGLTNIPVEPEIDNVAGSVLYGCSLLMDSVDVPGGVLCALDFHVLDRGSCALALDQDDSFLLDYDLNVIPTTLRDGFFDNRLEEVHDVAITGVMPSSTSVTVGDSVIIDVTVENEGNFEETFDVTAFYDGNAINTMTGVSLNAGEIEVLPFTWDTTGVPLGTYTISASATIVTGEEDTADNFLEDGIVRIVEAPPPPGSALWIEPSIVEVPKARIGDRFDVTLWTNLSEASFAWQVKVLYPSTFFNAVQVYYTAGGTSDFFSGHSTVPFTPIKDNTEGYILHGESLLGADSVEPGSGSLVGVEFELQQVPHGTFTINFSTPYGEDTFVLNPDLVDIPVDDIRGTEVHVLPVVEVHDVAVVDVVPSATSVFAGQSVIVDVTVENQGNFTETFDVAAYYDGFIIEVVTATLNVGEVDVVSLVWDTTGVAAGTYAISVEASVLPGEMDVADNFLQDGIVQVLEPPPYIPIIVNIHPETLNLKSKGRWITCVIELPEGYSARDIDISTIMLNNIIPVARSRCRLMVKFDRAEVISYIRDVHGTKFGNVQLTVTGELYNGIRFEGSGTIKVRMPGDVDCNGKVNVRDVALVARRFGQHQYDLECDLNEDGKTDFRDIVIAVVNFGKTF